MGINQLKNIDLGKAIKFSIIASFFILGLILFSFSSPSSQPVSEIQQYNETLPSTISETTATQKQIEQTKNSIFSSQNEQQTANILFQQQQQQEEILYPIIKVIDGDTLSVNINSQIQTVRLIGLDTPETVHPSKPVECFGKEASAKAREILTNQRVKLEKDLTQGDYDKYGRLLAYVFLEDGINFNKFMIEEGYGYEYTYNFPYKYQSEFKFAEQKARELKKGLWADGVCDTQEILNESGTTQLPLLFTNYECSYNAYNCSDFFTHAEAQAVYELCGGVSNDVHRLDRDKDGLACESLP